MSLTSAEQTELDRLLKLPEQLRSTSTIARIADLQSRQTGVPTLPSRIVPDITVAQAAASVTSPSEPRTFFDVINQRYEIPVGLPGAGAPPFFDRTFNGSVPENPSGEDIARLGGVTDRLSGPWYSRRSGPLDTIVFHSDIGSSRPTALVEDFNYTNWVRPVNPQTGEQFSRKSYHMQLLKAPQDGKGTNFFVPFAYDAWHALKWSNQSIGIAFNQGVVDGKVDAKEPLTAFQIETATQWIDYICKTVPTIKNVTAHYQIDPTRKTDPAAPNFNLKHFVDVCSRASGRTITECPVGSDCRERSRGTGGAVAPNRSGVQRAPFTPYPKRQLNSAAIAAINGPAAKVPVLTGVADLRSFHPNVQYELTRRRLSQNTIHTHMPFVKLTSLMSVTGSNLTGNVTEAWCPSIGIHGERQTNFEDIYAPQSNRNLVGYAVTCNDTSAGQSPGCFSTPVLVPSTDSPIDPKVVPPPGIVSVSTERNLAGGFAVRGGLFKATVKIQAHSVGQLNTLIRYFLRPSTMVVLEMGRESSQIDNEGVIPELPQNGITPFPWYRTRDAIKEELQAAIAKPEDRTNFVQKYVYNNFGKYEIFICYVANFKIKLVKNVYEIELLVNSVQQMELATRHTGVRSTCVNSIADRCKAIDVTEYFDDKFAWKENTFHALLSLAADSKTDIGREWSNHIVPIRRSFTDQQNDSAPDSTGAPNGIGSGFYISWRFFVEKVLHDKKIGLLSIFQPDQPTSDSTRTGEQENAAPLLHSTLISPIAGPITGPTMLTDVQLRRTILSSSANQLVAHEVGYHPALRSTNPGVMLIYNPEAQKNANVALINAVTAAINTTTPTDVAGTQAVSTDDEITTFIASSGAEVPPFTNTTGPNTEAGTTFLTNGVWLNSNMVKLAFAGTDSVSTALKNILNQMNNATEGYWNLQLLSNDTHSGTSPGLHVVDAQSKFGNIASTSTQGGVLPRIGKEYDKGSAKELEIISYYPNGTVSGGDNNALGPNTTYPGNGLLYVFNRRYRKLRDTEDGSELLDLGIDYDLPTALFVQAIIGAGGTAQRGLLRVLDTDEINNLSLIRSQLNCPDPAPNEQANRNNLPPCRYDLPTDFRISAPNTATPPPASPPAGAPGTPPVDGGDDGSGIDTQRQQEAQRVISRNENYVKQIREYGHLGTAINLVEFNGAEMLKLLDTTTSAGETTAGIGLSRSVVHPFNSSNLTKTQVELTLPGVGGVQLWQTFALDRVPSIIKQGAYVVSKVNHEFSMERGWTTKLTGKFRYLNRQELVNIGYNEAELAEGT